MFYSKLFKISGRVHSEELNNAVVDNLVWYVFVRSDHIPDLEVSQPLAFSSGWNVRSDGQNLVSAQIFNKLFTVLVFLKYFYISVVESIFC